MRDVARTPRVRRLSGAERPVW